LKCIWHFHNAFQNLNNFWNALWKCQMLMKFLFVVAKIILIS
jgi:hypothetical protein